MAFDITGDADFQRVVDVNHAHGGAENLALKIAAVLLRSHESADNLMTMCREQPGQMRSTALVFVAIGFAEVQVRAETVAQFIAI